MTTIADVAAHAGVGLGHRVAGAQREPEGARGDPSPGAPGDRGARLPPQPARPRPLPRSVPDARRGGPVLHPRLGRRAPPRCRRRARREPLRPRALQRRVAAAPRRAPRVDHRARPGRRPPRPVAPGPGPRPRPAERRPACPSSSSTPGATGWPSVVTDDVLGGRLATQHLVDLGHTVHRVHRRGPDEHVRLHLERAARARATPPCWPRPGSPTDPSWCATAPTTATSPSSWRPSSSPSRIRPPPCSPRRTCRPSACWRPPPARGLRVPEDLSVIGFDDIELSAYVGLTTVRQPLFESGQLGARLLLAAVAGEVPPAGRAGAPAGDRRAGDDRAAAAGCGMTGPRRPLDSGPSALASRSRPTAGSRQPPPSGGFARVAEIVLDDVWKVYPDGTEAVRALDLAIADGEFVVLVGPSGCGKTTALRMVAGLEVISKGTVCDRRPRGQRRAPQGAGHRDGVPELRALPAHDACSTTWPSG